MLAPPFGRGILFACFWSETATENERCCFKLRFSVALLNSLEDFAPEIYFGRKCQGYRKEA